MRSSLFFFNDEANSYADYDASYLHLAMRNGIALATLDEKLISAAKKGKVALWERK